jgi:hypothetical protein
MVVVSIMLINDYCRKNIGETRKLNSVELILPYNE